MRRIWALVVFGLLVPGVAFGQIDTSGLTGEVVEGTGDVGTVVAIVLGFYASLFVVWSLIKKVRQMSNDG